MQDELEQFNKNKFMTLVECPQGVIAIGMKWVFKNKTDEMAQSSKIKQDLLPKDIINKRELIMKKHLHQWQEWKPSRSFLPMPHT